MPESAAGEYTPMSQPHKTAKFRAPLAGCPIGDFGSLHQGVLPRLLTPIDFRTHYGPRYTQGPPNLVLLAIIALKPP
jgi:hypothetical protein